MPGSAPLIPLDETKSSELRSRVSLSALQSQQKKMQEQQEIQSQNQSQQSLKTSSRHLSVSLGDAKLFQQMLLEYKEAIKTWAS
jgi:hypothetical protein